MNIITDPQQSPQPNLSLVPTDNAALTVPAPRKRTKGKVENDAYAGFLRRAIRAYARRVADGDVEALADMIRTSHELDEQISVAVKGLHEFGYSYTEIADRLGVTKQAVQKRWGQVS